MVQPKPGDVCMIGEEAGYVVCVYTIEPATPPELKEAVIRGNTVVLVHLWVLVVLQFAALGLSFLGLAVALWRRRP